MFTLDQIKAAHSKVKSGADFPKYVQDLKKMGMTSYENYVTDGHTDFYGSDSFVLEGPAKYPAKKVADTGSAENLQKFLSIHQQGQSDYPTFCQHAADAGVEKWKVNLIDMTCTYYDKNGTELVKENIPQNQ